MAAPPGRIPDGSFYTRSGVRLRLASGVNPIMDETRNPDVKSRAIALLERALTVELLAAVLLVLLTYALMNL